MSHGHDTVELTDAQVRIDSNSLWAKLPAMGGVLAIAGLGGAFAMRGGDQAQFHFSFHVAFMYCLALGIGAMGFVLIQHATRAGWSIVVRRIAENVALTVPVVAAVGVVVMLMGSHDLFHWTHAEAVASDPMLTAKAPYLNDGSFKTRAIVYLVLWSAIAIGYWRWSTAQDNAKTAAEIEALTHRQRWWAPLGIMVYAMSLTFAGFDWLMSLDPHWFSTIFGVYFFAGAFLSLHAFLGLVVVLLHRSGKLRGVVTVEHFHDLGKFMFAFTVFWAYIGFSQYFLIWYASIPEETEWFSYRGQGAWLWLSILLVLTRFVAPFLFFMSRWWKRQAKYIAFWACWVLAGEFVDIYWLVQPVHAHAHGSHEIHFGAVDLLALAGMVGLFLAVFGWATKSRPLVPMNDPRLPESVNFENF